MQSWRPGRQWLIWSPELPESSRDPQVHHEMYVLLSLETHQEECHLYMYVYISVFGDWKISSQLIGPDTMCNIRESWIGKTY